MWLNLSYSQQQVTFKGKKLKLGPAIMKERSARESGFQGLSLFWCVYGRVKPFTFFKPGLIAEVDV